MKPLMLIYWAMPVFIPHAFHEVSHLIATSTNELQTARPSLLLFIEPPPPSPMMEIITTIFLLASICLSIGSLVVIWRYRKKEATATNNNQLDQTPNAQYKHPHTAAMVLLFVTILFIVLSILSFLYTEPGMKPHPLAEPDRPAPILIADPHASESLLLLLGIVLASASMLSLLNNRSKPHKHGLSIVLAIFCVIFVALGGLHYWFTFSL